MAAKRRGILCVGLVCLDIINSCNHYPKEDTDVRATDQKWSKGGNASNTLCVLTQLDSSKHCELLATLGQGMETDYVLAQLDKARVDHTHCKVYPAHRLPTSCVLLNTTSGTRTIVHYRNLPELTIEDFKVLDISKYDWIHFEGRNPDQIVPMVTHIRHAPTPPIISIELEKMKPELSQLINVPDVLFVSKEYAQYHGYKSASEACEKFREKTKENAIIICAWSDQGAVASDSNGKIYSSHSFPPSNGIVDTLGAGDTFNAGVIHTLNNGGNVQDAVIFGCKLAGKKCGQEGFDGLIVSHDSHMTNNNNKL